MTHIHRRWTYAKTCQREWRQ